MDHGLDTALREALAAFAARRVAPLAETHAAVLWRVTAMDRPAVLKLYKRGHPGNEAAGAALMRAWEGSGAMVRVLHANPAAQLLEVLEGPRLGDLARGGQPEAADRHLAEAGFRLHRAPPALPLPGLVPLQDWLAPLLEAGADADRGRAIALAYRLLASAPAPRPLHGDLHHDNVILTARGPVAYDAKGLLGDPAFELANALRHPSGLPEITRDPAQLRARSARFARALDVPQDRLLGWAAVKCAHSIVLRAAPGTDPETELLAMMLDTADAAQAQ